VPRSKKYLAASSQRQASGSKLLDLNLEANFTKEILSDRKSEWESDLPEMVREQTELSSFLISNNLPDKNIEVIECFFPKPETAWVARLSNIRGDLWTWWMCAVHWRSKTRKR
jgi:hypothetical protein